MVDSRAYARWFLGAMLGFPLIRFAFSFGGLLFFGMLVRTFPYSSFVFLWLWLAVGLIVTFVVCWLAVGRKGAPSQLWFASLASSTIQLAALAVAVFAYSSDDAAVLRQAFGNAVGNFQYGAPAIFFVAVVGYVVVAGLGCWLGARQARQRLAPAPQQATGVDVTATHA